MTETPLPAARPKTRPGRHGWLLLALLVLPMAGCDEPERAAAPTPPPPVTVVRVEPRSVAIQSVLPGRTAAFETAEIRPQVSGVVRDRLFREGEAVKAGQALFQIDPAPYRAALANAAAGLARAEATLQSARATASRYRSLVGQNTVSRMQFDIAIAAEQQGEAGVASAQASLEAARIDLDRTRIVSPIDGRTSRSALTVGALATANQAAPLLTVTRLDPIYVDLTQPADALLRLRRDLREGRLQRTAENEAGVRLLLADGSEYPHPGRLQFSEVTVDSGTGSVTLRATFPNPEGTLLPGLFVRARLEAGVAEDALLVPQQAVTRNSRGEAVALVVDGEGAVRQRVVRTRQSMGNKWLVEDGLSAGDRVVVEGVQRVRDGVRPEVREVTAEEFDRRGRPAAPVTTARVGD